MAPHARTMALWQLRKRASADTACLLTCIQLVTRPPLPANPAVGKWLFIPGVMDLASLFAERFGTCHTCSFCLPGQR